MRIAECNCEYCGLRFKIEFKQDMENYKYITCPICTGDECKVNWIMRNGEQMDCPKCSATLIITNMTINGNPITEIKCSKCSYMRLRENND